MAPSIERLVLRVRGSPLRDQATIVRNLPVYETACDNLGFTLAETEIIVEVQADIQIREPSFDALLWAPAPFSRRPPPGRWVTHLPPSSASGGPIRSLFRRWSRESVGLCGKAIETPEIIESFRGQMYRCETVNRGPWVVFKTDLERHGYLDERHFFQGNDDHDYHRRLFGAEGRRLSTLPSLYAVVRRGAVHEPASTATCSACSRLKARQPRLPPPCWIRSTRLRRQTGSAGARIA
jgi:hypothetical protein